MSPVGERISNWWMGKNKDVQPRTRKAAGPAEQAARSSMIARKAAGERKKAVEAAAAGPSSDAGKPPRQRQAARERRWIE